MNNEANKLAFFSALRTIAAAGGGYFVGKGLMDEATAAAFGVLVMIVAPLIWGMLEKFQSADKAAAREAVAVNVGILTADATPGKTPMVSAESAKELIAETAPMAVQLLKKETP